MNIFTKDFLLTYNGRINRKPFWMFVLASIAANIVAVTLDSVLGLGFISLILTLVLIYPSVCVYIKRFHDRDKSGWWLLIALVPLIGAIWLLVDCGILPGTPGPNKFGEDPLAGAPPA